MSLYIVERKREMNKCPKCGKESDSKFCPECGTKMLTDETDVMHQIPDREGKSSSKDKKKASKAEKKLPKRLLKPQSLFIKENGSLYLP